VWYRTRCGSKSFPDFERTVTRLTEEFPESAFICLCPRFGNSRVRKSAAKKVSDFMKFIADVMLGRLARQLRLLGFDVAYDHRFSNHEIIRIALEQKRIILTRDTVLINRPLAVTHFFVRSDHIQDQIVQFLAEFGLVVRGSPLSRCSLCNETLVPILKQNVQDRVPQYVYVNHDEYLQCSCCERVYWEGTHTRNMTNRSLPG
jgi:uncharacterized protein